MQLNEMLRSPAEGHFWQVDHIRPVYEGGGQCSLENLQTLCTVCHKEVSGTHTYANPGSPGEDGTRVVEPEDAHAPIREQNGMGCPSSLPTPGSEERHSHRGEGGRYPLPSFSGLRMGCSGEHSLTHEALVTPRHRTNQCVNALGNWRQED